MELYDKEDEELEFQEEGNEDNESDEEIVWQAQPSKTPAKGRGRGKGRLQNQIQGPPEPHPQPESLYEKNKLEKRGKWIQATMGPMGKLHNIIVSIRVSANCVT